MITFFAVFLAAGRPRFAGVAAADLAGAFAVFAFAACVSYETK